MHIAQVNSWSEGPRYTAVDDLPAPSDNQLQLRVLAAGLHQVVRSRASGTHYSAAAAGGLPHAVGVDCVCRHEPTGRLYYAFSLEPGAGTFAERVNVGRGSAHPLPDGADPVRFAASLNPAMSGWMALTQRAAGLPPGFTTLDLGATSASGRLAAPAAPALGAGRVVGVARDAAALDALGQLLDDRVVLREPARETDLSAVVVRGGCDVVLDYVYGDAAVNVLSALAAAAARTGRPLQYVSIGGLGGQATAAFPSVLLRSCDLTVRGAAPGAWRLSALRRELPALVAELATWELAAARAVPLSDIEKVWNDKELAGKERIVFVP